MRGRSGVKVLPGMRHQGIGGKKRETECAGKTALSRCMGLWLQGKKDEHNNLTYCLYKISIQEAEMKTIYVRTPLKSLALRKPEAAAQAAPRRGISASAVPWLAGVAITIPAVIFALTAGPGEPAHGSDLPAAAPPVYAAAHGASLSGTRAAAADSTAPAATQGGAREYFPAVAPHAGVEPAGTMSGGCACGGGCPPYSVFKDGAAIEATAGIQLAVRAMAAGHGYPEKTVFGMITAESEFDPAASGGGGRWLGLAQISPYWLKAEPLEPYRLTDNHSLRDLLLPEDNLLTLAEMWAWAREEYGLDPLDDAGMARLLYWHNTGLDPLGISEAGALRLEYVRDIMAYAGELADTPCIWPGGQQGRGKGGFVSDILPQ